MVTPITLRQLVFPRTSSTHLSITPIEVSRNTASTWSDGRFTVGSLAASTVLLTTLSRTSHSLRKHRRHSRSWLQASPMVVDAEIVCEGSAAVNAVLERIRRDAIPVRSRLMEYLTSPKKSALQQSGIALLAAGGKEATDVLVKAFRTQGLDQDRSEVAAAILCLMLGAIDEAHNLVTPHSWPSPTTYGGPAKYASEARDDASYCHMIVHRMEGENLGEFGTGFDNSKYWIGKAFGTSGHAIFPQLKEVATALSSKSSEARAGLKTMGVKWDPVQFNKLCADALLLEDEDLQRFCSKVQTEELMLLFNHVTASTARGK